MIISRVDWAGRAGPVGSIYIIGWNKEAERPPSSGLVIFEKPDGSLVHLHPKEIRVVRLRKKLPVAACRKIAKRQLEAGNITMSEYRRITTC